MKQGMCHRIAALSFAMPLLRGSDPIRTPWVGVPPMSDLRSRTLKLASSLADEDPLKARLVTALGIAWQTKPPPDQRTLDRLYKKAKNGVEATRAESKT